MTLRSRRPRAGLLLAALLLATGCATAGRHVPQPFPRVGGASLGWADPYRVTGTALALRGVPYVWGGDTPAGFDCSGFTRYVFDRHGVRLPRQAADQYEVGARVDRDDVRAGDLVFFSTIASGASHVGVALGDDEFVHAPSERGVVRVERLSGSYWAQRWLGARRVIGHEPDTGD